MRTTARTLLVVLGLLAALREAGSAACASSCPEGPLGVARCGASTGATACGPCAPCGRPEAPCPLLEPTPEALVQRAAVARALPEPVAFADLVPAGGAPAADPGLAATAAVASPARGIRPRAGPLWLLDRRLLI